MARLLQIAQLGHPVLRQTARAVADPESSVLQELIRDMMATVIDADGAGIAAPQVYESQRVFIMASRPNPRYPYAPHMDPTVLINPEIIHRSRETEKGWEGCLSIPGIRAQVPRSTRVDVRFTTVEGTPVETSFQGFLARVFQHEFDHLNGTVYLDRVESGRDIVTEKEFFRLLARETPACPEKEN